MRNVCAKAKPPAAISWCISGGCGRGSPAQQCNGITRKCSFGFPPAFGSLGFPPAFGSSVISVCVTLLM